MKSVRTALIAALAALAALSLVVVVHADPVAPSVTEIGHGPTVVFVPSLGLTRLDWMPTAKRLFADHHVVLVDLPGQNGSTLPDPFSLQNAAAALDQVLAHQPGDSTIVVGHNVGGLVAMLALSAHPERARGLVLIDTQFKSPLPIADQQREMLFRYMDENYDAFMKMAFARAGRDSAESARLLTAMSAVPPVTVKSYLRELIAVDANKELKGLKVPITFALADRRPGMSWGTISRSLGIEDSTMFTPHRIANAGYMVMKDAPDSLAAIIGAFSRARLAPAK